MRTRLFRSVVIIAALIITGSAALAESANQNKTAEPAERLTAEGLAARVLEANPGLVAIEAAAEAAAFRVDPAGSLDDPMLSYGVAPLTAGDDRSINQRIDFNQKIPWPGTLAARESAARYDALAAERDVDARRLRVIAQAKAAYAEWYFVHAALKIHDATQALLDELIATAETRYATGRALKQDVLQAEVERTDLDNHLLRLLRLKATVQARINALLNQTPNAPLPPADVIPKAIDLPAFESMQGLALSRHPELAQLDARISASVNRITLAEKAFYPDFQVGVGYNSLWDNVDKRPIFGISINVPLDRSKRRSDLGRAQAEKRRAEWILIERRAELLADLTQARAEVVEAQSSVDLLRDQLLPLSTEYLEAAITDYQSGSGSFLNVITAEQRALNTELALARARADYARRLAELERWVGGPLDAAARLTSGEQQ